MLEGPSIETAGGAADRAAVGSVAAKSATAKEAPARAGTNRPVQNVSSGTETASGVRRAARSQEIGSGRAQDGAQKKKRPGVTVSAIVIMTVLLLFFWWLFARRPAPTSLTGRENPAESTATPETSAPRQQVPAPAAVPPPPVSTPAVTRPGHESHVVKPNEAVSESMGAPGATPAAPVTAKPAAGGEERGVWHVIVYTFNHQEQAQHRAEAMATRYGNLQPQVFSPTGGTPYFVALGGGMSRREAYFLRNKAREAGLPQDTYMQNYSR